MTNLLEQGFRPIELIYDIEKIIDVPTHKVEISRISLNDKTIDRCIVYINNKPFHFMKNEYNAIGILMPYGQPDSIIITLKQSIQTPKIKLRFNIIHENTIMPIESLLGWLYFRDCTI